MGNDDESFRSESCLKKKEKSNAMEINRAIGRRDRKEGKERRKGKRRSKGVRDFEGKVRQ